MEKKIYKTTLGKETTRWSFVALFVIGISFLLVFFLKSPDKDSSNIGRYIGGSILFGVTSIILLTQVRHYEIRKDFFVIKRILTSVKIPFSEIIRIEKIGEKEFKNAFQTWGNGGVLGYWGSFYSDPLHEFDFYAKNRKNPILIVRKKGKIVVSPDDITMFDELEQKLLR